MPVRIVVSNQRGGVAKTTTVMTMARYHADLGRRVLIIDTDPQGSIAVVLGLRPEARSLHSFLIKQFVFEDCLTKVHDRIDVLMSDRDTAATEAILMGHTARELTFQHAFSQVDQNYDVVLIDVAPSITLLQTCAMIYAGRVLIPVTMDPLSLTGAMASIETAKTLNRLFQTRIQVVGLLPVNVDNRLQMARLIGTSLQALAEQLAIPVLPEIRTDATVAKAARNRQFLQDFAPSSRVVSEYTEACRKLDEILNLDDGRP